MMKIVTLHIRFFVKFMVILLIGVSSIVPADCANNSPTPYIIYRENMGAGFWSNFFVLLAGIDRADREGWIPVIDIERYPSLYKESEPILGVQNAWEYFFEQPGGMSLKTALSLDFIDNQGGINDGVFSRAITIQPAPERKKELKN